MMRRNLLDIVTRSIHCLLALRRSAYTCIRRSCNKYEILSLRVCYEKCKEHYTVSLPRCFEHCDYFCGSEYENAGLFCRHKKIYKKICQKPIYILKSFKYHEPKTSKGKKSAVDTPQMVMRMS